MPDKNFSLLNKNINSLPSGTYYGIPMSVRPFHMSRSNLRTPWPIHFKFNRVNGIDGLTVCILYGEILNFHSRVMELYSSNCRRFFVCRAVNDGRIKIGHLKLNNNYSLTILLLKHGICNWNRTFLRDLCQ
jgi:hypothetical protein